MNTLEGLFDRFFDWTAVGLGAWVSQLGQIIRPLTLITTIVIQVAWHRLAE